MTKATEITITKPDDWHTHLRDKELLSETVPATERCFARAIVMPNLVPPVTTTKQALDYRDRILEQSANPGFKPLVTLYLTDQTEPAEIFRAKQAGIVAAKLYPAGATTNSDSAVSGIQGLYDVFEAMSEAGMLLLIHGEVTESHIDIFDREKAFIDQYLIDIQQRFTNLKIVFEHITTRDAVQFVNSVNQNLAATITPQHLLMNRNDLLVGGLRPHNYCLPILKRETHQTALLEAVGSGSSKFFLGSDSAPHHQSVKESACGCAGCYSAWAAIELYAQAFDGIDALHLLDDFAGHFGADFYNLPRSNSKITLVRENWQVPQSIALNSGESLIPFYAGATLNWKLK